MLALHPHSEYVGYFLSSIQEGFQVGYERGHCALVSARRNMKAVKETTGGQRLLQMYVGSALGSL